MLASLTHWSIQAWQARGHGDQLAPADGSEPVSGGCVRGRQGDGCAADVAGAV